MAARLDAIQDVIANCAIFFGSSANAEQQRDLDRGRMQQVHWPTNGHVWTPEKVNCQLNTRLAFTAFVQDTEITARSITATLQSELFMCRNIKTLFNFEPPATNEEIRASSIQFVRKLSGSTNPSRANEAAFDRAVEDITQVTRKLLQSLVTNAPPKDRHVE